MNYTFHQLRIFVKVCELQSVTKTAEALYLTQPAVSIQLKKLQEEFKIPLFEVIGRQLHITDFGKTIRSYSENILSISDQINIACDKHKGLVSGKIKIAAASTGKYVIPYFLADYIVKYPQVKIEIDVTNKTTVVENLKDNIIDFALVSTLPSNMALETVTLMPNELHLIGSNKYYENNSIRLPQLSQHTLILREKGSATRAAMLAFLDSIKCKPVKSIQLTSNEAVKQAVRAGLGLSIMPLIGVRTELKVGSMKIIKTKGLPIISEWNLVYSKGKELAPAAKELITFINQNKARIIEDEF